MSHSFFSPSKGAMWMECAGSLAMPENQVEGGSSKYADDGTVSHTIAAWALETGKDCREFPSAVIRVNGADYPIDEERIDRVQSYVDDIRRDALGGILWAEHRVDLSRYLGMAVCETCKGKGTRVTDEAKTWVCPTCGGDGEVPQGGTSDAVIILPNREMVIVSDFKDGAGEKVYASYFMPDGVTRRINHQTGLYALGVLEDVLLLGHQITKVIARIYQPRLNHIDEFEISVADLLGEFAIRVVEAATKAGYAMVASPGELDAEGYLAPGTKTCRWCAAKARCPALRRFVAEETRADFDDESVIPAVPESTDHLAKAYKILPLIEQWVKATRAAIWKNVDAGNAVLGPDGLPLKLVEGKQGDRKWADDLAAEAALLGQLAENAYKPREVISAPAAAKLLDRKKTKALWRDVFEPLIKRAKGAPTLALGSDTRPVYGSRAADSEEFNDEIGVD